jgi:four helix bundle protein
MTKFQSPNARIYDLEDRTLHFAKNVVRFCQRLSRTNINQPLINQLVRSAGSIGANYREANDALGNKDFIHRLRIARKEAKETLFWLELVAEANASSNDSQWATLKQEVVELKSILSAIIKKSM